MFTKHMEQGSPETCHQLMMVNRGHVSIFPVDPMIVDELLADHIVRVGGNHHSWLVTGWWLFPLLTKP